MTTPEIPQETVDLTARWLRSNVITDGRTTFGGDCETAAVSLLQAVAPALAGSVYEERNRLVAALSKHYPAHMGTDVNGEPGFATVVCLHLPTGQAAWHIPDSAVPLFRQHLAYRPDDWDGHNTALKYARLGCLPYDPAPTATITARYLARITRLEELARDMLSRFTETGSGHSARVGRVQIGKWEELLNRRDDA